MARQAWIPWMAVALVVGWTGAGAGQTSSPPPEAREPVVDSLRRELHCAEVEVARLGAAHWQTGDRRHVVNSVMTGFVFIAFFSGLFTYLILRQANQRKVFLAAIERGVPVPLPQKSRGDARRPALFLVAVGLGFSIAMYVTLSLAPPDPDTPAPLAVSIWGIVPILVGAALWVHQRIAIREQREGSERGLQGG
ncbi:MAG: hypothetical protein AB1505_36485 [Candidatus Latescibacterota bacterium]